VTTRGSAARVRHKEGVSRVIVLRLSALLRDSLIYITAFRSISIYNHNSLF
jgi:hypothetical protein